MIKKSPLSQQKNNSIVFLKRELSSKGGLEKYAAYLQKAFEEHDFSVQLLSEKTFSIPKRLSAYQIYQYDKFCSQWMVKNKPSLVFGLDRNRYQTHLRAGNGCHAAYLQHRRTFEGNWKYLQFHFNPLHRLLLSIEKASFENPHLQTLFTNSNMVKNEILHFYKVDPAKIEVVHNGVEWISYQSSFDQWPKLKEELCHKYHLDPKIFHFLFIGNGFRRKGLDFALKTLSHLPPKEYHLSILGKDKHLKQYQQLAQRLNVHAHFFGPEQNVVNFYALADATLVPSIYDPFANVTLESLAMGVPVISSNTNGGSEILTHETGQIIEDLSSQNAFLDCLKHSLKIPKTLLKATSIRDITKSYEFSQQLSKIIQKTIPSQKSISSL